MFTHVIVHFAELFLKKGNRGYFEKILEDNIKKSLGIDKIEKDCNRFVIKIEDDINVIKERLLCIPGIANFAFCFVAKDIDDIKEKAAALANGKSFKIHTIRSNKKFPYTSMQINEIIGAYVAEKTRMKVNLTEPDTTIFIELAENNYIFNEKVKGIGGLPVGSTGKIVCLLSGGIDSPVAAYMMMRRGCEIIYVHFHNYTSKIEDKLTELTSVLSKYQGKGKIYLVPFLGIQEEIIKAVPEKYRMVVYRRFMLRIAERICNKEKAKGIVTGDSLSQVASQTMENLAVIYNASEIPVFPPLIGMDKEETIKIAKKIGTYVISIKPYKDCCSFMIAKHPILRADLEKIKELENNLNIEVDEVIEKSEIREVF